MLTPEEASLQPKPNPLFCKNFFDTLPITLCTWNTSAVFGALSTVINTSKEKRLKNKQKRDMLRRLLHSHSIVALQETRGTLADHDALPASHKYYGTFGDCNFELGSSAWGGVTIAVEKKLLRNSRSVSPLSWSRAGALRSTSSARRSTCP